MEKGYTAVSCGTLFGMVWMPATPNLIDRGCYAVIRADNRETIAGTIVIKDSDTNRWLVHIRPGFFYSGL